MPAGAAWNKRDGRPGPLVGPGAAFWAIAGMWWHKMAKSAPYVEVKLFYWHISELLF